MDRYSFTVADFHLLSLAGLPTHPVDPFRQHRQLRRRQRDHAVFGLRPHKTAALQTFGPENEPLPGTEQDLQQMTATATKNEELPTERVLAQSLRYQRGEAIEAAPDVGQACGEPDPYPGTGDNYPRNAVSTRRGVVRSTPSSTRTRLPSFSSISM